MGSKFDFNEIVKVTTKKLSISKYNGKYGVIRGKSQSEEDVDLFAYSVDILDDLGEVIACKFIFEEDLESTGKTMDPKKLYTGDTVRVRVDPETGEGEIVDDE